MERNSFSLPKVEFFPPCGSLLKEKEVKSDVKVV